MKKQIALAALCAVAPAFAKLSPTSIKLFGDLFQVSLTPQTVDHAKFLANGFGEKPTGAAKKADTGFNGAYIGDFKRDMNKDGALIELQVVIAQLTKAQLEERKANLEKFVAVDDALLKDNRAKQSKEVAVRYLELVNFALDNGLYKPEILS